MVYEAKSIMLQVCAENNKVTQKSKSIYQLT